MPNTKIGTTWAPDIRPENIETFEETYVPEGGEQQTATYRSVDHHPILNKVLDKLAFFRTHAGAVWYNLQERKTLLAKLNEQDAVIEGLNAKIMIKYEDTAPEGASTISLLFSGKFSALVTLNGSNSDAYGTYMLQGYGNATLRFHTAIIQKGGAINHIIDESLEKITFNISTGTRWRYSVLMFQGDLPIIS